jgi:hypothetical protein
LADEVQQRGIVEKISPRQVGRFLKGGRTQASSEPLLAERGPRGSGRVRGASPGGVRLLP